MAQIPHHMLGTTRGVGVRPFLRGDEHRQTLRPDVLVKGADYALQAVVGADLVQGWGGAVLLADLVPAHSTTDTIQRIAAFDRS
jgi:hypothetical protein